MNRGPRFLLALTLGLMTAASGSTAETQSRLVVDNRLDSSAEIQVWRHDGKDWTWTPVTLVDPGKWVAIYDVHQSERFRAWLPARQAYRYHNVSLDQNQQDVWWIQ